MDAQEFQRLLQSKTREAEEIIYGNLPKEQGFQKTVIEAMNYSVKAGGKRLRPILMLESYRMFGGKGKEIEPMLTAIEMIHTYSLVHDDLPAMDNDAYRRGRKTTWKVYGDAMGILAGDGLLNLAFETAFGAFDKAENSNCLQVAKALKVLANKAGIYGMIGGQTADIEAEEQVTPLSREQLLFIHEHKTAALIQASLMVGAILAGAEDRVIQAMEKCGYNLGVAFQIQDDILDVIGDSKKLGKPVGSDDKNNKQTYVTLNGLEQSKEAVEALSDEAIKIIEGIAVEEKLADTKMFLIELMHFLIARNK